VPIYYDGFESYALGGQTNPFGSFTNNPAGGFANSVLVVSDNYLPSGSQALQTRANFANCSYPAGLLAPLYSSGTVYAAIKFNNNWNNQAFLKFYNGDPYGGPSSFPVFTLATNLDGTISAFAPNATLVSVPCGVTAAGYHVGGWYFLQVNVTLVNVGGFVELTFAVSIDKVTVMSGTVATGVAITSLLSGTAQFDHIYLDNNLTWDEFTFDALQAIGTFPNPGSPKANVSTGLVEVVESTTSANAVVSTGLIELIISGENQVYEA
jgi:hypothetical protein